MTKLKEVFGVTTPPDFDELEEGSYTLRAPFRDSDYAEGGALQVGLEPYEFDESDKRPVVATIRGELGHRAIELSLPNKKPFMIESSLDAEEPVGVLSRAVSNVALKDTQKAWMDVEVDGDEPLSVTGTEGAQRLLENLVAFALVKQRAAARAADEAASRP